MDTAENYSTRNLIADIWHYVRSYKREFWVAVVLATLGEITWLYPAYALAAIVTFLTKYTPGADLGILYSIFFLTAASITISYIGFYFSQTIIARLGAKVCLDAELAAMKHIIGLDIAWHEKESTGGKFKRIERGGSGMDKVLRILVIDTLSISVSLIGAMLIMLKIDVGIGIALAIFLATYYSIARFYRNRGTVFIKIANKKEEYRSGILFEAINNVRSVKIMSMGGKILKTIAENAADIFRTAEKRIFWMKGGNQIRNYYGYMFRISMMLFIAYGIMAGHYEVGFLVLFHGYFNNLWQAISKVADISDDFAIAKNGVARMQDILTVPIAIDDETGKVPFPQDWQEISLKNISFSYNNKPVLRNISFTVKRGEKIGVVGLSGAGKSTLFKLLLKEHESYKGTIAFDGVPLTGISKKDYFNYVAVVLQETELFNASLKDNVTITNQKQEKNKTLFEKALVTSHVKDFMPKLPKGTNTIIGEKGVKLSGGEKQRVGIARAIFKDPQVFLLDEATSHLDIESEEKIQDSLHAFFGGVTAIVIAHRLTTIKEMDRILVIEDGKILESGTFAELHAAQGRFFELWEKQKL